MSKDQAWSLLQLLDESWLINKAACAPSVAGGCELRKRVCWLAHCDRQIAFSFKRALRTVDLTAADPKREVSTHGLGPFDARCNITEGYCWLAVSIYSQMWLWYSTMSIDSDVQVRRPRRGFTFAVS